MEIWYSFHGERYGTLLSNFLQLQKNLTLKILQIKISIAFFLFLFVFHESSIKFISVSTLAPIYPLVTSSFKFEKGKTKKLWSSKIQFSKLVKYRSRKVYFWPSTIRKYLLCYYAQCSIPKALYYSLWTLKIKNFEFF